MLDHGSLQDGKCRGSVICSVDAVSAMYMAEVSVMSVADKVSVAGAVSLAGAVSVAVSLAGEVSESGAVSVAGAVPVAGTGGYFRGFFSSNEGRLMPSSPCRVLWTEGSS